jgi:PAS domain S-box-containing protein
LRASEERYRLLFERNLAGVFRSTPEGRLLDCNDSFARILGYTTRAEALAHQVWDFYFDVADREASLARLRQHTTLTNLETRLRRQDGTPIWVLENVGLLAAPKGEILEGTIVDITERKQTEEAMRASEAKYRTLIENLEQCIFLKDHALRFVAANQPFCRTLGRSEDEIVGQTDFDFYPRHLAEKYRADDRVVLSEGQHLQLDEQNLQGGRERTVRVIKTPVRDAAGQIMGVLGIFWDVTEQRTLEAQLRQAQKMEAVGQLAGGVAHDFNNLLTAILGNLSLALTRFADLEPLREFLQAAEAAAWRAAELTRHLLGFSRRTVLCMEPTRLDRCIAEAVQLLGRTIDPRIALDVRTAPDLWHVSADHAQLTHVLMNLCLNARDAMPCGGYLRIDAANVTLTDDYLRTHLEARPGQYVRLSVGDTGHGMTPEVRQRMFEPFFTTKEVGKGTGLGLAMVFGMVTQHQGWIDCDSEDGRGARFDVYLPRIARETPGRQPEAGGSAPGSGHETILLADDEEMIRRLGKRILQRFGYQVVLAEDGKEAVEIYQREHAHIDLVILDVTMPRLSGPDAYRQLQQIDPQVRVLFSSGYATDREAVGEYRQACGFIAKPYRVEELAAKVRTALVAAGKARGS